MKTKVFTLKQYNEITKQLAEMQSLVLKTNMTTKEFKVYLQNANKIRTALIWEPYDYITFS